MVNIKTCDSHKAMLTNDSALHNGAAIGQTFKGMLAIFNLISMKAMLISSKWAQFNANATNFYFLLNTTAYIHFSQLHTYLAKLWNITSPVLD